MAAPAQVAAACASQSADTEGGGTECAAQLQAALKADAASLKAMQAAAKANDVEAAKKLLVKMGLTEQQVAQAKIVLRGPSSAARVKDISIEITCCPLTITIRF